MSGSLGREKTPEAVRLRRQGLTNTEIAERLGVTQSPVYVALGRAPWSPPHRHPAHLRERAEDLRWKGYSVGRIAYVLGVPRSTVGDWVKGI